MKIRNIFCALVVAATSLFGLQSCQPDSYDLGERDLTPDDLVQGIAYDIVPDKDNPNIINLISKLPGNYQVLWEHPQGRTQSPKVALKIPFAGQYKVRMGVETRGGVVYGPETTFTISDFCADFVTDELWSYISGGVGNSKKWYCDLDANGVSRYFSGPLYFKGLDDNWESVFLGQDLKAANPDADSWSWDAGWSGISGWQWGATAMDFGYMEFDLINGSNVHVVMNDLNREMTGKFMIDVDNHTISFTDAEMLHESVNDGQVAAWTGTFKLLSLTENTMQIGIVRTSDPCLLCLNFISEDYFNNWSPEVVDNTNVLPGYLDSSSESYLPDWRDYVEPKTQKQTTFKLAVDDTPFDWVNLDGTPRGVTMERANDIEDLTLSFNRVDTTYTCTAPDGTVVSGKYSLGSDGVYTFENGLPEATLSTNGLAVFKTNADKTLRITGLSVDSYTGGLGEIWLGSKDIDDQGNHYQYCGYHFVPYVAGGGDVVRYEATLNYFDTGWAFQTSEPVYVTGDGDYTFTINGASGTPYGIFLDIPKLYRDHNNCDIIVKSIRCDGADVSFDDSLIDRGTADNDLSTARRYILNPWGATADDAPKYVFNTSLVVTVHVTFDCGSNVMAPEAGAKRH